MVGKHHDWRSPCAPGQVWCTCNEDARSQVPPPGWGRDSLAVSTCRCHQRAVSPR